MGAAATWQGSIWTLNVIRPAAAILYAAAEESIVMERALTGRRGVVEQRRPHAVQI